MNAHNKPNYVIDGSETAAGRQTMLTLKQRMVGAVAILACSVVGNTAWAEKTPLENLDCRHLFVEDVEISDKIETLQRKESSDIEAGKAEEDKGFFVKLDPIPGIGVTKGMILTPAGKPLREDSTEMGLDALQTRLLSIRSVEQRKVCPEAGTSFQKRTTILDDQVRGTE